MKHPNMDGIPLLHPKMCIFIQERAIQYLDFVAIQQFHPIKNSSNIPLRKFCIAFE
jgi:hypothetical protein